MSKMIAYASFFKRIFKGTVFSKHFENYNDKVKMEIYILPETKVKTLKQNNTFWGLVDAIYTAGGSSCNSLEEFRIYFMERAGLVKRKQISISPKCRSVIEKISKFFWYDKELQSEILGLINRTETIKYTSLSIATSKTLSLMIDDVINYYQQHCNNIEKVEEILKGIDY